MKLLDGSSWNCLFSYSTVDFAFQEIPFLLSCPLTNIAEFIWILLMTIIPCRSLSCCRQNWSLMMACICSCFQDKDPEEILDGSSHRNISHHNSPIHKFFDKVCVLDFLNIFQLLLEDLFQLFSWSTCLALRVFTFLSASTLLLVAHFKVVLLGAFV